MRTLLLTVAVFFSSSVSVADDTPATAPAALAVAPHDPGNLAMLLEHLPRSPYPEADELIIEPTSLERLQNPEAGPTAGQDQGDETSVVPWDQAKDHVGKKITAEGTILRSNNIGHITFLNFVKEWRGTFTIVIFEAAYKDIPAPPEKHFLNKKIRATGVVTLHKGSPNIEVRDARQIQIVE